uniref:Uncharacterized protein n=1 Tax=Crocodylus porosus TaxID=8502 RepID=A0A7M4E8J3_CROPO
TIFNLLPLYFLLVRGWGGRGNGDFQSKIATRGRGTCPGVELLIQPSTACQNVVSMAGWSLLICHFPHINPLAGPGSV